MRRRPHSLLGGRQSAASRRWRGRVTLQDQFWPCALDIADVLVKDSILFHRKSGEPLNVMKRMGVGLRVLKDPVLDHDRPVGVQPILFREHGPGLVGDASLVCPGSFELNRAGFAGGRLV